MFKCSQCDFTSEFESALKMHRELHHNDNICTNDKGRCKPLNECNAYQAVFCINDKGRGKPLNECNPSNQPCANTLNRLPKESSNHRLLCRTTSATRLFDRIRAKLCRSKPSLSVHVEETPSLLENDLSIRSEGTSNNLKAYSTVNNLLVPHREEKERYGCHLCSFVADRITVLDRHLLNDHKIGEETLLTLVLNKTKDSISDTEFESDIDRPYYKPKHEVIDNGGYIIESVTPKIKISRHIGTNTDLKMMEIPELGEDCELIKRELKKLMDNPTEQEKDDFVSKMQMLNSYMCKFVDSSNALKKVLAKESHSKHFSRGNLSNIEEHTFDLGLGDLESPRPDRPNSEKLQRSRSHKKISRNDKEKFTSESFYF